VEQQTGDLLKAMSSDAPETQISRVKNSGNAYVKAGNFECAIKCYTEALQMVGDFEAKGLDLKTEKAILHANRSFANLSVQGTDDHAWDCTQAALLDARAAIAIDPTYPKAHHRLGQVLKALGDSTGAAAEAFASCKKLQQQEKKQAALVKRAAAGKAKYGEPVLESVLAGASASAIEPGASARAIELYNLGEEKEDSGDYDGAEASYRAAIAADATHAASFCALGGLLMAVRADYPGAIAAYRSAVTLEPDQTEGYSNLCGMLAMGGDFKGAEKLARALIDQLPPGDPEGSECLRRVLEEKGKAS
jgi:tetratricopeptide (TPR) repeat protein